MIHTQMNCEVGDSWLRKIYKFFTSSNNKSSHHSISQVYLLSIWLLFSFSNPVEATDDQDSDFEDSEIRQRYKRGLIVILGYTAITMTFLICIHLRQKICTQRDETAAEHDEYGNTTATRKLDIKLMESFPEIIFPGTDAKFHLSDCHICLEEFKHVESLVVLPTCAHAYHKDCIQQWMATRNSCCPDCRHDYGFV